jgi:hypothetical protein
VGNKILFHHVPRGTEENHKNLRVVGALFEIQT